MSKVLETYTLRLGDTCLVLSHRLAELCSKGPYLEEDIAMTNISLDLLGRAEMFLDYSIELSGEKESVDDLVYRRNEREYCNMLITELPNSDFGHVIMRQFLFDAMMHPLLTSLKLSKDERLAAIGEKGVKESTYHLRHSRDWIIRLAQGTEESLERINNAINALWTFTDDMFEWTDDEKELSKQGLIPSFDDLKKTWLSTVKETFNEAGLTVPENVWMHSGGKDGMHTEHLGFMLAEMQFLPRAYPDAKW